MLIHEKDGNVASQQISTIRAGSEFFGFDYETEWFPDFHDPLTAADPDVDLMVDSSASLAIGEWFRFGIDALDEVRLHGQDDDDVSEVQLWPEHFDPATELGEFEKGQRASFGASPGDGANPEPYMYVASWSDIDHSNPFWNGRGFNGASLGYAELLSGRAVEFLLEGYRVLHAG